MRKIILLSLGALTLGTFALAEKHYGAFVNAASGASLPAAFEIVDGDTLRYCFNDVENNCFDLPYDLLEGNVIQARFSKETQDSTGNTVIQTNLWTWTPTDTGYHGTFAIQYGDAPAQVQTTGDFTPAD